MGRLAGKVALITGAGTGIGRATAQAMAVFLASEESRKITGHVYPVDSGITIS